MTTTTPTPSAAARRAAETLCIRISVGGLPLDGDEITALIDAEIRPLVEALQSLLEYCTRGEDYEYSVPEISNALAALAATRKED